MLFAIDSDLTGGDEFRLLWECDWQRPVGPPGAPQRTGYVRWKAVEVQLRTIWVVLAEIAKGLYSPGSLGSGGGAPRVYTHVGGFQQPFCVSAYVRVQGLLGVNQNLSGVHNA